jgi:hypothetical protein
MTNWKEKKIAVVYGQGIEGCGVTRVGAELELWSKKVGCQLDTFSYDEKFYTRRGSHKLTYRSFTHENVDEIKQALEKYDLVIFNSYPNNKYEHEAIKKFYHNLFKPLQALKVMFVHEISKANVDKICYLVPMLNDADLVYHFGTDTWMAQQVITMMPSKKANERMCRFKMWMNFEELLAYKEKYPIESRKRGLTYVGRWSTLKNIDRTVEVGYWADQIDPTFVTEIHGIEASVGAKFQIIDHEWTTYTKVNKTIPNRVYGNGPVKAWEPCTRDFALNHFATHMFGSAFYSLPKQPQNYGDRMEYTQIEIIGTGAVPLFDRHWAEHNRISDGTLFSDIPDFCILSDGTDVQEVAAKIVEMSHNIPMMKRYQQTSFDVAYQEFNADRIIPETLEHIFSMGKDTNKYTDERELLSSLCGPVYAEEVSKFEAEGKIPALGIQEVMGKQLSYLDGAKQVFVKWNAPKAAAPAVNATKLF